MNMQLLISLARNHKKPSGIIAWELILPYFPNSDKADLQNKLYNHMRMNKDNTQDLRKNHKWTSFEKSQLLVLVEQLGKDWKRIITNFPGKNIIQVKNQYHQIIRKGAPIHQLGSVDSFDKQLPNTSNDGQEKPSLNVGEASFRYFEIL